jgi:penicillin-binding protein 2
VWFVGITPRRNPELVVAVLFQNGDKSWFAARIGARVVEAYVDKQRRLMHNLPLKAATPPKPVEVGAVWSTPDNDAKNDAADQTGHIYAGRFFVDPGKIASDKDAPEKTPIPSPSQLSLALPTRRINLP